MNTVTSSCPTCESVYCECCTCVSPFRRFVHDPPVRRANCANERNSLLPHARLYPTAHRGSQVPVRSQFVDRNGIQPRVRQQAVTFVSTVARRTGMIVREAAGRRDTCAALKARRTHKSDRKMLQNSRTATRSINILALVSYIRVLISRTCNHLSFPIGTPRCHRSLPWALHVPSDHHGAAELPIC